jgi:hypothetical protein
MSEHAELAMSTLTDMLELPSVGLSVKGVRIVGRGSAASADILLSDGRTITFEKFSNVGKPSSLRIEVATTTGATSKLTQDQALQVIAWMRIAAEHIETSTIDDIARDWGTSFLAAAEPIDVDMNDQAERWGAFQFLVDHDPVSIARNGGCSIAKVSRVLIGHDGRRYVRTAWMRAYVRSEDASMSPAAIANAMQRVGWHRPGSKGRIIARRPEFSDAVWLAFYIVPANWEYEGADDPLTLDDPSYAHAHMPARKENPSGVIRSSEAVIA